MSYEHGHDFNDSGHAASYGIFSALVNNTYTFFVSSFFVRPWKLFATLPIGLHRCAAAP
jgi:hypothetical protein